MATLYNDLVAIEELARDACRDRHRRAVVVSGGATWCRQTAVSVLAAWAPERMLWFGESVPLATEAVPAARAQAILGQEIDAIVMDGHSGFNLDAFGAASGTLNGGGLCLLLAPLLDEWPAFDDPDYQRIRVAGNEDHSLRGRFLRRLVGIINSDRDVALIREDEVMGDKMQQRAARRGYGDSGMRMAKGDCNSLYCNEDQHRAVDAVEHVARGHRNRPLVLVADRGRGKSAALGIAAARLLRRGTDRIIVTAPNRDAAEMIFKHAGQLLDGAYTSRNMLDTDGGRMEFFAPDELLRAPRAAKLLFVDEAATLPTPLLLGLLQRYSHIVFSTTVHGYEGTGRGFAVRFYRELDARCSRWARVHLSDPVRWARDDPLERFVFRALLLDAEAVSDDCIGMSGAAPLRVERLDRDRLVEDEALLNELFGLLVLAHYQTRPFDLRLMLDAPNVSVYVIRRQRHVVATALVAREGGLNRQTAYEVWGGCRRPQGHLLPESIAVHVGLRRAATMICDRVVRIAVHPRLQRHGIGTRLLERIVEDAARSGCDYVGSSFGASETLMRFWYHAAFTTARLSVKRDAASGEHSALVLRALTGGGQRLVERARRRFTPLFLQQLSDPLRHLETDLVVTLLAGAAAKAPRIDMADWRELVAFAHGRRLYEVCMDALWKLVVRASIRSDGFDSIPQAARDALIRKVLQKQSWKEVAEDVDVSGRRGVIELLRQAARRLVADNAPQSLESEILRLTTLWRNGK